MLHKFQEAATLESLHESASHTQRMGTVQWNPCLMTTEGTTTKMGLMTTERTMTKVVSTLWGGPR